MNLLNAAWHWYMTVETSGYWVTRYDGALAAIAGVAVVVWTGGLIAYQIKAPNVGRTIALNFVQNSFMLAVLGLFPHSLSIRIVMTVLIVLYTIQGVITLRQHGNVDFLTRDRDKYPSLTDEYWKRLARDYRLLASVTLGTVAVFYVWLLIWPYPIAFLCACALLLVLGLQSVLYILEYGPDDWKPQALIDNQWRGIRAQLDTIETVQVVAVQLQGILEFLKAKL